MKLKFVICRHPVRESLNLLGGIIVCGIVNHYFRKELATLPFFEDVLQEEVIRQRLKMWSGKEKELEETIIAEAEDEDVNTSSIIVVPEPQQSEGLIGSQLSNNEPRQEEKLRDLPLSVMGSFAESKKSKGSKKSKRSKASRATKKSGTSKKKKGRGGDSSKAEAEDTVKSSEEIKSS